MARAAVQFARAPSGDWRAVGVWFATPGSLVSRFRPDAGLDTYAAQIHEAAAPVSADGVSPPDWESFIGFGLGVLRNDAMTIGEVEPGLTIEETYAREVLGLSAADAAAAVLSGRPDVTVVEASSDDHPYGPWAGGSKAQGGHPVAAGGGGAPLTKAQAREQIADLKAAHQRIGDQWQGSAARDSIFGAPPLHIIEFSKKEDVKPSGEPHSIRVTRRGGKAQVAYRDDDGREVVRISGPTGGDGRLLKIDGVQVRPGAERQRWASRAYDAIADREPGLRLIGAIARSEAGMTPEGYKFAGRWVTERHNRMVERLRAGEFREAGDDHFYGAWSGGSKGAGGHPAGGLAQTKAPSFADPQAQVYAAQDRMNGLTGQWGEPLFRGMPSGRQYAEKFAADESRLKGERTPGALLGPTKTKDGDQYGYVGKNGRVEGLVTVKDGYVSPVTVAGDARHRMGDDTTVRTYDALHDRGVNVYAGVGTRGRSGFTNGLDVQQTNEWLAHRATVEAKRAGTTPRQWQPPHQRPLTATTPGGQAAEARARVAGQSGNMPYSFTDKGFHDSVGGVVKGYGPEWRGTPDSLVSLRGGRHGDQHVYVGPDGKAAAWVVVVPKGEGRGIPVVEVAPSARGHGIGSRLYDALQDRGGVNMYDLIGRHDEFTGPGKAFALSWLEHRVRVEQERAGIREADAVPERTPLEWAKWALAQVRKAKVTPDGMPSPEEDTPVREADDDHPYGRWVGGTKAQGGHVAEPGRAEQLAHLGTGLKGLKAARHGERHNADKRMPIPPHGPRTGYDQPYDPNRPHTSGPLIQHADYLYWTAAPVGRLDAIRRSERVPGALGDRLHHQVMQSPPTTEPIYRGARFPSKQDFRVGQNVYMNLTSFSDQKTAAPYVGKAALLRQGKTLHPWLMQVEPGARAFHISKLGGPYADTEYLSTGAFRVVSIGKKKLPDGSTVPFVVLRQRGIPPRVGAGHYKAALKESDDDHPYGRWVGGKKSEGGHIEVSPGAAATWSSLKGAQVIRAALAKGEETSVGANLIQAIHHGEPTTVDMYRGVTMPKGHAARRYKEGSEVTLNVSSWDTNRRTAEHFADARRHDPKAEPVVFILTKGAKVARISGQSFFDMEENEHVTAGRFRVVLNSKGYNPYPSRYSPANPRTIYLEQVSTFAGPAEVKGIREASDDHFYGPWSGGGKSEGGHPDVGGGGGGLFEQPVARSAAQLRAELKQAALQKEHAASVAQAFEGAHDPAWRAAQQARYDSDHEFARTVDAVTAFTHGDYQAMYASVHHNDPAYRRDVGPMRLEGGYQNVVKTVAMERQFAQQHGWQSLTFQHTQTYAEAQGRMERVVAAAPKVKGPLYRGERRFGGAWSPRGGPEGSHFGRDSLPKVGDLVDAKYPTSMSRSKRVANSFAVGTGGKPKGSPALRGHPGETEFRIISEIHGARGIDVAALSSWKQAEVIGAGRFKVTKVTVGPAKYRMGASTIVPVHMVFESVEP